MFGSIIHHCNDCTFHNVVPKAKWLLTLTSDDFSKVFVIILKVVTRNAPVYYLKNVKVWDTSLSSQIDRLSTLYLVSSVSARL